MYLRIWTYLNWFLARLFIFKCLDSIPNYNIVWFSFPLYSFVYPLTEFGILVTSIKMLKSFFFKIRFVRLFSPCLMFFLSSCTYVLCLTALVMTKVDKPEIKIIPDTMVTEGDTGTLQCHVTSKTRPVIQVTKPLFPR